jgi:hypothetical protein
MKDLFGHLAFFGFGAVGEPELVAGFKLAHIGNW